MLSLSKGPLTLVAANLSSIDIGKLSRVCKPLRQNLENSLKLSVIADNNPDYSEEMCHLTLHKLSCYAEGLANGFQGKSLGQIHQYVDSQRAQLLKDFEQEQLTQKTAHTQFAEMKDQLDTILAEATNCSSESKKKFCLEHCQATLGEISEGIRKIDDHVRFVKELIHSKLMLLSLEHLIQVGKAGAIDALTQIPYEQNLMKTFQDRVDREVVECGVQSLDKAIQCAQIQLDSRRYLVPFTSSPETITPYLEQLENNLVSELREKYTAEPSCLDSLISWFRLANWIM
jgi:hypothetical protein